MNHSRLQQILIITSGALLSTACAMQSERATGDYGSSYYSSDAGIADRVKVALHSQPDVDLKQIKIETFQGMVQISGQVASHSQAVRTIAALNRVDGVKTVRSYLIEHTPHPTVGTVTAVASAQTAKPALLLASNNALRSDRDASAQNK